MALIDTSAAEQSPAAARLRDEDAAIWGYVPNFTHLYGLRPEVYRAWRQLNGAIKAGMDLRRYELATVAAATALRSSYCALAHGRVLAAEFISADAVIGLADGTGTAELNGADRAVVAFARKVALHADQITGADLDALRAEGLADDEIFDVVLAAAARSFFSKSLDATGTLADSAFSAMEPRLREALTVGRPIDAPDSHAVG